MAEEALGGTPTPHPDQKMMSDGDGPQVGSAALSRSTNFAG